MTTNSPEYERLPIQENESPTLTETLPPPCKVPFSELRVTGTKLGEGGFSVVHEASWKGQACALKFLRPDLTESLQQQGERDMETESTVLQRLHHPHIVRMIGTGTFSEGDGGMYLVLERLYETLDQKLWPEDSPSPSSSVPLLVQRLTWALQIAWALQYLHQRDILYRDLKPANIAMDAQDQIRLLDFGLAKIAPTSCQERYQHTGKTGSWTYMAPEVAKGWAYNSSVDVYSFGILLWEICTARVAFPIYDNEEIQQYVIRGDERPPLSQTITNEWPVDLPDLLRACWSPYAKNRPTFDSVVASLHGMVEELEEERRRKEANQFSGRYSLLQFVVLFVTVTLLIVLWQLDKRYHGQVASAAGHFRRGLR